MLIRIVTIREHLICNTCWNYLTTEFFVIVPQLFTSWGAGPFWRTIWQMLPQSFTTLPRRKNITPNSFLVDIRRKSPSGRRVSSVVGCNYNSEVFDPSSNIRGVWIPSQCCGSWGGFCRRGSSPSPVDWGLGCGRAVASKSEWTWCLPNQSRGLKKLLELQLAVFLFFFFCHKNSVSLIVTCLSACALKWKDEGCGG